MGSRPGTIGRGQLATAAITAGSMMLALLVAGIASTGRYSPASFVQAWMGFDAGGYLPTNFWSRFVSAGPRPGELAGLFGIVLTGTVAAYGLGAYGGSTARRAARVLVVCALLAVCITLQADHGSHDRAVACALLAIALGMGEVASAHRDSAAATARHAQDVERAGLARELHDVVAHQLSAIAVQAGAARLAAAGDLAPRPVRPHCMAAASDWPGSGSAPACSAASWRPGAPQGEATSYGRQLPDLDRLTDREREVFILMVRGLSNPAIARSLVIGETTAKTHVNRIMTKLRLRDRAHAVIYGYETGLVRPGEGSAR